MSQQLSPIPRRGPQLATGLSPETRWGPMPGEPGDGLAPLDIGEILTILRRRLWLILVVAVVAGGAAWYLALRTPPLFRAVGTVQLADTRRTLTSGLVDPTSDQSELAMNPVQSQMAVLTSRRLVGQVVDSLPMLRIRTSEFPVALLHNTALSPLIDSAATPALSFVFEAGQYTITDGHGVSVRAPYGDPVTVDGIHFSIAERPRSRRGMLRVVRRSDAAASLASQIKTTQRENTNVIDVSYTSTDPWLAQRVVNSLITAFQTSSIDQAAQQARLRRVFVERNLRQNDSALAQARLALSNFRSRQQSYSAKEKFLAERSDLTGVEQKQQELDEQQRLYSAMLDRLQSGPGASRVDLGALISAQGATASPIVMEQYVQIQRLENVRDSLTTGRWASAPTNPDVQRVDALLGTARDRLKHTVQGILATLAGRQAALARQQGRNAATLGQIPATGAEEAQLLEREQAYQKVADQLREELQRARLAEAAEVGQVEVVDVAALPHAPVGIPKSRRILFGVLLGLFLGSGTALVLERLDSSIRGRDDMEERLRVPGLAVIPRSAIKRPKRARQLPQGDPIAAHDAAAEGADGGDGGEGAMAAASEAMVPALVAARDARSIGAEAYRTLRTKLLFTRAISELKTIVVTSPFAQEGKSTIAANLATTFAQHGMRVLLIDCDMRKPTQHLIFNCAFEPGLAQLLAGEGFVAGTGRRTAVDGLSLIPAGALPADPAEAFGSARMRTLLTRLEESFEVVILDTPPVLPVADTSVLAALADGVIVVVRAGQTDRRAAQLAVQQLHDVGAKILGAVLNDPKAQVPRYDRYGYATYYGYAAKT